MSRSEVMRKKTEKPFMENGFGLVALVAMMPLITVQVMGAIYVIKTRGVQSTGIEELYSDEDIIELWGDGA